MAINEGMTGYLQNLISGYGAGSPLSGALSGYMGEGELPADLNYYLTKQMMLGKQPRRKKVAKKVAKAESGYGMDIPEQFGADWTEDYMNQFQPQEGGSAMHQAIMQDIMASMAPFEDYIREPLHQMGVRGVLQSSLTGDVLRNVASDMQRQYMEQSAKARMMEPEWINALLGTYMQQQYLPYTLMAQLAGGA